MDFVLFFDGARRSVRFVYVRSRARKNDAKGAKRSRPPAPNHCIDNNPTPL